jgi:hypothetical protein
MMRESNGLLALWAYKLKGKQNCTRPVALRPDVRRHRRKQAQTMLVASTFVFRSMERVYEATTFKEEIGRNDANSEVVGKAT